jgi:DNA-binding GntR family transcriptional regulator
MLSQQPGATESALPRRGGKSRTLSLTEDLRREILDGRLMPGARLHVAALAERCKVSQGAAREALSRLVGEGLVVAIDRRGFRVSPLSIDDLQDLTRTRIEIEGLALRRSIANGDAAWEGAILAVAHEFTHATPARVTDPVYSTAAWIDLHKRFHMTLISACGSPRLLRICEALFEQSERYRRLVVAYAIRRDVVDEHHAIKEATLARDADAAVAALAFHYNTTAEGLIAAHRARTDAEASVGAGVANLQETPIV